MKVILYSVKIHIEKIFFDAIQVKAYYNGINGYEYLEYKNN